MIISEHARKAMADSDIIEEEVRQCLNHGELIIQQLVKGELRYGKQIDFKDKTIIVIYTQQDNQERIITTYPIRRKKQWQNESI